MRQIFYMETEPIFERACQLARYGDKPEDYFYESGSSEKLVNNWLSWYNLNAEEAGFTDGELIQAVAEVLEIPAPARYGFAVSGISHDTVIVTDLEENANCDLNDPDDSHLILPVTQFREWLYKWNSNPLNKVMDTTEAAAIWNYSSADAVKRLCREGKVNCRKLTNGAYIIERNQPSPKMDR